MFRGNINYYNVVWYGFLDNCNVMESRCGLWISCIG